MRVAYLGSGRSVNAAVIAAVHPGATVWAWDYRPAAVELLDDLREAAQLPNLSVHAQPTLPERLGVPSAVGLAPQPIDLVVVDHVLDAVDDVGRQTVLDAVGASLRPGGIVAVTYRTAVGWAEIDPMVRLLRYMVTHHGGPLLDATAHAVAQLIKLRDAGAVYMNSRPAVMAWLEELADTPPAQAVADYLEQDLRPLSHAQLSDSLGAIGCHYLGGATLDEHAAASGAVGSDGGSGGDGEQEDPRPQELLDAIAAAPTVELRETYRDLAWRRTSRADVFRLGRHLGLRGGGGIHFASLVDGDDPLVGGCGDDRLVELWRDGLVHPMALAPPDNRALAAASRLTAVLAADTPAGEFRETGLEVVAPLGSAFTVDRSGLP